MNEKIKITESSAKSWRVERRKLLKKIFFYFLIKEVDKRIIM